MEILIKIAQLVVCLSLLVMVHEFGHFIFARIFKIRVEKFYLFFNPWFSLFKFRKGDTEYVYNTSNANGMEHTTNYAAKDFHGLCFVNLVDFDMVFGHRRNIDGYANALSEFDAWLGEFQKNLGEDDLVMITADHGCDPAYTATTDHTREYVPLLILGKQVKPGSLGTRASFADIAATVAELLNVEFDTPGESFAAEILP